MRKRIHSGYRYLYSYDESGDLCANCDYPMVIDKSVKGWALLCRECGRVVPFVSNASEPGVSVYK
jgi:hypothetical protein